MFSQGFVHIFEGGGVTHEDRQGQETTKKEAREHKKNKYRDNEGNITQKNKRKEKQLKILSSNRKGWVEEATPPAPNQNPAKCKKNRQLSSKLLICFSVTFAFPSLILLLFGFCLASLRFQEPKLLT